MNPFDAIVTLWSYVAVVFAVLPPVAPFPLYDIVYVFGIQTAFKVTSSSLIYIFLLASKAPVIGVLIFDRLLSALT